MVTSYTVPVSATVTPSLYRVYAVSSVRVPSGDPGRYIAILLYADVIVHASCQCPVGYAEQ